MNSSKPEKLIPKKSPIIKKQSKDPSVQSKYKNFPTGVHQIMAGVYIGRICKLSLDDSVEPNIITVFAKTEKGEMLSKDYTVDYFDDTTHIKDSTPLYFFLSGMNVISLGGGIKWKQLIDREVLVTVKNGKFSTYTKSITPYNENEDSNHDEISDDDDD